MLFNSLPFLVFFVVVTAFYFALEQRFRWVLLLSASCVFYMFFKPEYILILGFTIVVDYYVGIFLERIENPTQRKWLLIGSVIANVGILAVFKYYNFINDNVTGILALFGWGNPVPYLHIILPIGLSFHTFQAMSYTIEVYRGHQKAERHFGYYALYVMYYPQLVAGPIERPQNLIHQFHQEHFFDNGRVVEGLQQMLWGFFKKIVIADTLAYTVNEYYSQCFTSNNNSILVILFFSFQIYCDFSGYSDIAIGASKVMGIQLMKNFDAPYFSTTVTEFWRRWHISLSTWFRDYLFIPLGGSQGISDSKVYRNIMVVFLLSGLWHGANWTFILWGMLHGLLLILERMTGMHKGKYVLQGVFTFVLVSLIWVFFRAENFSVAVQVLKNLSYSRLVIDFRYVFSLILIFFLLFVEYAVRSNQCNTLFDLIKYRWLRYLSYIIMVDFILYAFNKLSSPEFIYFQF